MAWRLCQKCNRKLFDWPGRAIPLNGYCERCYETVTGQCAGCEGTGQINRAHLGTAECPRCDGSGQAKSAQSPVSDNN
jgi:DnaJ-class molecular chaperone